MSYDGSDDPKMSYPGTYASLVYLPRVTAIIIKMFLCDGFLIYLYDDVVSNLNL